MPERSSDRRPVAGSILRLLRPVHWIKNGFVLAPLLFAFPQASPAFALRALTALLAFCFASSAVYAVNDILDRDRDRACPLKRGRPVASGDLSTVQAGVAAAACALAAACLSVLLLPLPAAVIVGVYAALNLLYSLRLKHVVIMDVIAISTGFVLRVFAGAMALAVPVSAWMILTTFFLSLFLGFTKRRAELATADAGSARQVLGQYSEPFLLVLIALCAGLTIMTYALSVIQPSMAARPGADTMLYTVPVVVYGLLRYLLLSLRSGKGADVAELVIRDIPLLVTVLLWGGVVVAFVVFRV